MILLSNPRSGSNWFLDGLENYSYSPLEIFNNEIVALSNRPENIYKNVSVQAKFSLVKNNKNKFFKIHFVDLTRNSNLEDRDYLIDNLKKIDNLYLLTRRNVKKSVISFAIAYKNGWNFHGDNNQLTSQFSLTVNDILLYYDFLYEPMKQLKDLFKFKETFVYEDLVSGKQVPKSLKWNPRKSTFKERNSMNYVHLITNWEQVESWIDELLPKEYNV